MARRDDDLFDLIVELPWWIGVIISGVLFVLMRFVMPPLLEGSPMSAPLAQVSIMFAPWAAALALLASAISGVRSLAERFGTRRDSSKRTGMASGSRKVCPRCGADMVVRKASRGAQAGLHFWGCSNYPQCHHTEDVA